ncbi:tripartite motif-containing protein 45-like [Ostrea edulis]|uniref:tripartite motif-containing protein 45-like n=1 Tax=Ostrea edulis TaxID=37623 RepID=UPI0024AF98EB|nr:tripartite motif-containing protein 45-like [Ostrea edulis]
MATSSEREEENFGLKVCCICFEHYKTPRCLPCSHSFCEACLSAHIQSSCSDCNPPLGFPCPLCQVFVPAPGRFAQYSFKDWARVFPENKFLASIAVNDVSLTSIPCHPCKEDGEDARGTSWCVECSDVLCDECVKCHRRSRPSRHHEVVSLTNISGTLSQKYPGLENCETHGGRKIEVFCENHLAPCCSLCVIKEHGGCSSLCHIEEAAEKLLENDNVKNLQDDVEKLCTAIEGLIKGERVNIDEIDNTSDRFTKEISDTTAAIIQAVKNSEETHLDELRVRYSNDLSYTDDVAVDDEESVIYSSYSTSTVRKVDRKGNILFTYSHEELKKPCGLTVDRVGNIYVIGKYSNNVHILSRSGEVVRILNGVVTSPECINIQEGGNRFFVGEAGGIVKIFEFKWKKEMNG